MRISLRVKLTLAFFFVAALGFFLIAFFGFRLLKKQALNGALDELYRDAYYLSTSYQVNDGVLPQSHLETMAYSSNADIWVLADDGTVTAHSGTQTPPASLPSFDPTSGTAGYYMVGRFYGAYAEDVLSVYTPLTKGVSVSGYVVLHYPYKNVETRADNNLLIAYLTYGAFLAILVLMLLLAEIFLVRPLHRLQTASHEYANGNLSYPLDIRNRDEIGDTAERVSDLAQQLNSAAEDQRRFLANVSHDFRSPLTSIRGYVAAMEDGTIPPEMQSRYLNVVLNETDRLTRLANELLDLTQLEKGVILNRSVFDMNDLIRDLLPTFEGRVEKKHITFELTFEEESAPVNGDREKIQQVLHNLVDNAIKFSDNDSTIDISTQLHGDKLFISVADHGEGIEKENLNRIWERFYKTDTSRGRDKSGTGLGLAIVREIIQAHRENIDVISTPGVGTKFIFSLPAA